MASTLPWTILRPGGLTDQPGTGRVQLGTHVPFGDIPVLAAYLSAHRTMINGSALCAALAVTERD